MLIRCYFAITVMVDTISSASSRSPFRFPLAIGTIHHVLLQHFDSYSDHAMFFLVQVWGGYMRISSQLLFVHYIYMCVCVCISFWLINLYL